MVDLKSCEGMFFFFSRIGQLMNDPSTSDELTADWTVVINDFLVCNL